MSIVVNLLEKRLFNEKTELLKKLLNESFGFNYVWPENGNQAIYDFYALSLVDPWQVNFDSVHDDPIVVHGTKQNINKDDPKYHDYIDLTDLRYSLMRAKVKNADGMKKMMIEATRRAVICELKHFVGFFDIVKIHQFSRKVSNKAAFEIMKKIYNPHNTEYASSGVLPGDYDLRYKAVINNPLYAKVSDKDLFQLSAEAFDPKYWSGAYGGAKWVEIAKGGLDILNSPELPDESSKTLYDGRNADLVRKVADAVDHSIDLAHNTGTIFTKWKSSGITEATLETKKHITNIKAFVHKPLVSDSLKDAITYLARYETLTKKDLTYTKKRYGSETAYDIYTHKEVEYTLHDKLTDNETAKATRMILAEIGIHDTPDAMAAMTVEVKKVLDNINYNKKDPMHVLAQKTEEWKTIFNETLTRLEKSFGVDKINTHNRTLIIKHLDELSRGVKTRKQPTHTYKGAVIHTDYTEQLKELMKLPWVYSGKESLDSLIARYKITDKTRLTAEDYDYLEEWLKNHYKDDYQEFEIFTNNFVPDFEKMSGTKMSPKQVEYIDHLIDKSKSKGYSRRVAKQGQPTLDL